MRVPFYDKPQYPRFPISSTVHIHMMEVIDFLKWVLNRDKLEIAEYLNSMGQDPFFLVAATGLGKTVGVPIHMLIRQIQRAGHSPHPEPRVWIVEPRIPIAVGQAAFMNMLWKNYSFSKGKKNVPPLFGCITSSSGNVNPEAPVKFVTTGIFELMTKDDQLNPERDRVIIDEAHVTIEQNPGVELGIALARRAGITVDYMSATVDTAGLSESLGVANIINADKQRFIVWRHNLLNSVAKSLTDLVDKTLVTPDLSSEYFPQPGEFSQAAEVCAAVMETGRSHGMLVVVNSFAGEFSDTQRLAQIIRKAHPDIPVLQLASEVIRDPRRMKEYETALQRIEREKRNYVILATSVVEMGITFPTLDYVVTMDSGYDQETIGDTTFPVVAPLGVNSLLQRVGRVGRKRPGIAYIANEVGADYAELEDEELNAKHTLVYEQITFPLATSSLMTLAYYACKQGWQDIGAQLADLNLPSKLHESPERMDYLQEQVATLVTLGLVHNNQLTPLGESMEKWIGQADIAYAVQLQKSIEEGSSPSEVIFWLVATALSNTPITTLRAKYDYFVDRDDSHGELSHGIHMWPRNTKHEDLAVFSLIVTVASAFPQTLWRSSPLTRTLDSNKQSVFGRWCNQAGVDGRKLSQAAKAIQDIWKLFGRINGETAQYKAIFGTAKTSKPSSVPWKSIRKGLPVGAVCRELCGLSGTTTLRVTSNEAVNAFTWVDTTHGYEGLLSQDDTPLLLEEGIYSARLIPSRETKDSDTMWRAAHLGH
jgi:hypothetical protein